jgi:hypothetical protein
MSESIGQGMVMEGIKSQMDSGVVAYPANLTLDTITRVANQLSQQARDNRAFTLYTGEAGNAALNRAMDNYILNTDIQNNMQVQMEVGNPNSMVRPWINHADWQAETTFRTEAETRLMFGIDACGELDKLEEQFTPKTYTTEEVWLLQAEENIRYDN